MSETTAPAAPKRRFTGRIAVVTGASRGFGAALAEHLAREGAHLVLVARTVGGLEAVDDRVRAAGSEATLVPLDLCADAGIERLGGALAERFGKLDALIACAGRLGSLSPVAHTEPHHLDGLLRLHVQANHRLIRSLEPLLRAAESGRAVFVTGTGGLPPAFAGAYAASTAALQALVRVWACEIEKTRVRVNLVDPGPLATRFRAQAFPGEDPASLPAPADFTGPVLDLLDAQSQRHGEILHLQDDRPARITG